MVNSNQEKMFWVPSQEGWLLCFIGRAPEPEQEPSSGVSQVMKQRPYDLQRGWGRFWNGGEAYGFSLGKSGSHCSLRIQSMPSPSSFFWVDMQRKCDWG